MPNTPCYPNTSTWHWRDTYRRACTWYALHSFGYFFIVPLCPFPFYFPWPRQVVEFYSLFYRADLRRVKRNAVSYFRGVSPRWSNPPFYGESISPYSTIIHVCRDGARRSRYKFWPIFRRKEGAIDYSTMTHLHLTFRSSWMDVQL